MCACQEYVRPPASVNAMITFTVKHSCGHEVTHGCSGAEGDRDRREAWLRRQPCQACWRVKQSSAASAQSQDWKLPSLEGAEADHGWAEVIRMKVIAHNKDFLKRLTGSRNFRLDDEVMKRTIVTAADEALRELESQRSSAWWIGNRFEALSYVKRSVVRAITPILNARGE